MSYLAILLLTVLTGVDVDSPAPRQVEHLYDYKTIVGHLTSAAGDKKLVYEIAFAENGSLAVVGFTVSIDSVSYDLIALETGIDRILGLDFGHLGFLTSEATLSVLVSGRFNANCPRGGLQDRSIEDLLVLDLRNGTSHWVCSELGRSN